MMKQVFYSLRFILLSCLLITGAVHLHGVEIDGIIYDAHMSGLGDDAVGDTACVIGVNSEYTGAADIPASIEVPYTYKTLVGYDVNHNPVYDWVTRYLTYRVTSMRCNSFAGSKISSFSAPGDIKLICTHVPRDHQLLLKRCTNLKSAIVPSTVTNLDSTFAHCTELTSVNIPNTVTSLKGTFYDCNKLPSVNIPNTVTSLMGTFQRCWNLTNVSIPSSVTYIGYYAFYECRSLTSISIPNSVNTIDGSAFAGCISLTNVCFPSSVKYIGSYAFSGCSGLTSVTIPETIEDIGEYAFGYCGTIAEVTWNARNCRNVSGGWDDMKGYEPYYPPFGFTNIEHLIIGPEVLSTNNIFCSRDFTTIENVIPQKLTWLARENTWGILERDDQTDIEQVIIGPEVRFLPTLLAISPNITSIGIPNSVEAICQYSLYGCSGLSSIIIPNSVRYIQEDAFIGTGITSITIPENVTALGDNLFEDYWSVPSKLSTIYYNAKNCVAIDSYFENEYDDDGNLEFVILLDEGHRTHPFADTRSLKQIIIGSSVEAIGGHMFGDKDYDYEDWGHEDFLLDIDTVMCHAVVPPVISIECFSDKTYENAVLCVPNGSIEAYRNAEGWKEFFNCVPIDVIPGDEDELKGDVNGDSMVNIEDVTVLINYLLSGDATGINLDNADCDKDGRVDIGDLTLLINYLLSGSW